MDNVDGVTMKICPACGTQWPDAANFCPKDGTNLAVLPVATEEMQPIVVAPDAASVEPAVPPAREAEPASPDVADDEVENEAAGLPAEEAEEPSRELSDEVAEKASEELSEEVAGKPDKKMSKEDTVDGEEEDDEPWGDDGAETAFSDTQWFMAAENPDDLKDEHDTREILEMQDKYRRDESISEEKRSRFTLRKKKK